MRNLVCATTALATSLMLMGGGPVPTPPGFHGKITEYGQDATPWWPEPVRAPAGAPNVLVWLIDDAGYGQIGAFGGLIDTPNIDALAKHGLTYTNFHSTALCSPSRAALLTGRNHHAVALGSHAAAPAGFPGYFGAIPKSAASLAKILDENGYTTFALGKWDQVPGQVTSIVGPFDQWPSGQGFEHFYGFLAADSNQFLPDLWSDHAPVEPQLGHKDYHLSADLADKATEWITGQVSAAPDRPFFMYFATGAVHAPHQAPSEYIEKYRGRFDMGWDKAREIILARQKKLGIVPADTELPPRPPQLPAWDSLSVAEKRMAAHQMEVFAAELDHADHEFGRIVETLRRTGQLDNTIVIVTSDNGASAEGGPAGSYNEDRNLANHLATPELNQRFYDAWGGPDVHNHYAAGWAMAGNTPFSYYKQTVHGGGVNSPMVISWPKRIKEEGQLRRQFHHLNDVTPTILDLVGIKPPEVVDGVEQQPMDGVSMAYSFDHPNAPSTKTIQYFELFGNRAIYANGWKAVALANPTPWFVEKKIDFSQVKWELYDLNHDINERVDLAKRDPKKLEEMLALFDREARKYNVYPIRPNYSLRQRQIQAENIEKRQGHFVYYPPGAVRIPYLTSAPLYGHSFEIAAYLGASAGAQGVIAAQGGNVGGFSLFVKDGRPTFVDNYYGESVYELRSDQPLPEGPAVVRVKYDLTGPDGQAHVRMFVNDAAVGEATFPRTQASWASAHGDPFDVGQDSGSPASPAYASPFPFTGKIDKVVIEVGTQATTAPPQAPD